MKSSSVCVGICVLAMANLHCNQDDRQSASRPAPSSVEVSVSSPATQPTETSGTTGTTATSGTSGTVLEVMDSGGYTYVRIQTKEAAVWAAGPQTAVKVGQSVQLAGEIL